MNSNGLLLALLSLGHFSTDFVQGALPALLPFLKERFGLSYTVAGMLLMAAHVSSSVIQPFFGYFTDRRPFSLLLPLGLLVSALGLAMIPLVTTMKWLVFFVILMGVGTASFHPEGFKTTACVVSEKRATGMSVFSFGGNLGMALGGPAAIFLASRYGLRAAIGVIIPAIVTAMLFFKAMSSIRSRVESAAKTARLETRNGNDHPYRIVFLIMMVVVLRSWTHLGLATYIPFIHQAKLSSDPGYVASLLLVFLGAGTVGTIVGGPIADRVGHRKFLFASVALTAPLIYLFLHSTGWLVFVMAALTGGTIISSFSVSIVMAQELFPNRLATASGAIAGFAIGTGGIGVTLLGAIADRFGIPTAMLLLNAFPVAGAIIALIMPLPWKSERVS
ncbi:MAG: MFS transporter [Syntrophorhabdaceae bacterium]|nr:MFS transporter [Syntrophorhabdaceae bacterium]